MKIYPEYRRLTVPIKQQTQSKAFLAILKSIYLAMLETFNCKELHEWFMRKVKVKPEMYVSTFKPELVKTVDDKNLMK